MAKEANWFSLSSSEQIEALEYASSQTGRPPHLLEKDIWAVWTLSSLYSGTLAEKLTFKGGTSLSKVYHIIDRFSEDIDLTYDIRELIPDLLKGESAIPTIDSKSSFSLSHEASRLRWKMGCGKPRKRLNKRLFGGG